MVIDGGAGTTVVDEAIASTLDVATATETLVAAMTHLCWHCIPALLARGAQLPEGAREPALVEGEELGGLTSRLASPRTEPPAPLRLLGLLTSLSAADIKAHGALRDELFEAVARVPNLLRTLRDSVQDTATVASLMSIPSVAALARSPAVGLIWGAGEG